MPPLRKTAPLNVLSSTLSLLNAAESPIEKAAPVMVPEFAMVRVPALNISMPVFAVITPKLLMVALLDATILIVAAYLSVRADGDGRDGGIAGGEEDADAIFREDRSVDGDSQAPVLASNAPKADAPVAIR